VPGKHQALARRDGARISRPEGVWRHCLHPSLHNLFYHLPQGKPSFFLQVALAISQRQARVAGDISIPLTWVAVNSTRNLPNGTFSFTCYCGVGRTPLFCGLRGSSPAIYPQATSVSCNGGWNLHRHFTAPARSIASNDARVGCACLLAFITALPGPSLQTFVRMYWAWTLLFTITFLLGGTGAGRCGRAASLTGASVSPLPMVYHLPTFRQARLADLLCFSCCDERAKRA